MHNNAAGWTAKSLEQVVINKGLVRGPFGGALKKDIFVPSGYKVYEQRDAIYGNIKQSRYFIDEQKYNQLSRFAVKPGDFIVSCSGTIGRIYRIPDGSPPGVINQALLKITVEKKLINPVYFYHYFRWSKFQAKIIDSTQGGAMQNLVGMEIFKKTEIAIPPLGEQNQIVKVIDTWEKYLESLERIIELKKSLKDGLTRQLLSGNKRLAGFKDNWQTITLGDIGKVSMCKRIFKHQTSEAGDIPFYKIGTFGKKADSYISAKLYQEYKEKYSFPKLGDILISASGTIGRTVVYDGKPAYFQDSNIIWIANDESLVLNKFLYHLYNTVTWHTAHGTIARLYNDNVRRITVKAPALEEQRLIADILSTIEQDIKTLQNKRNLIAKQRDYLIDSLVTGSIRLPMSESNASKETTYA